MAPLLLVFLLLAALTSLSLYLSVQRRSSYWKSRKVPSFGNIFSGCFKENFNATKSMKEVAYELYLQTKQEKCIGTFLFGKPILIINDPEIIKRVLVSEFHNYNSHGIYYDIKRDPISGNLFVLEGADWKEMRTKLTPLFTTGKVKYMFNTVLNCVQRLDRVIDREKATVIDTRLVMSSLSIDVIASAGFGIEANCLENPNAEFGTVCRSINSTFIGFVKFLIQTNAHWLVKLLKVKALDKTADTFFKTIVRETVTYREKNNITRNDFIDLMIRLKNSGKVDGSLTGAGQEFTMDEIAAQAFIFFLAGFETTSQANTLTLFQLAKNPDIQRRVQKECDKTLQNSNGQITYEAVNEMPYTEQVLKEIMRLYPALQVLVRSTMTKCTVPLTDIELDKGTTVWIPLAALHSDPEVFPDPEKFNPERFSEENITSIPQFMFMPFGDGPRICIGMKFSMVTMKAVMLYILSKYNIDIVEDTPLEVKLDPRCFFPNPMGKFKLKFTPRNIATRT